MRLELATVISCGPDGCLVTPLADGPAIETRYSDLVKDRVKIRPGQLVAIDQDPPVPEIAWRWYPARVVDAGEVVVTLQERERQLNAARVPGLDISPRVGDTLLVTGMAGTWEIHDRVVDGRPVDPSQMSEKILPRVAKVLEQSR